jgi:Phage tail tube protein, GTA-gp10
LQSTELNPMPNLHRGEIEACLDGRPYTLCLTLGALAELEHAFGHEDMLALAERFQSGRLSARDAQRIIGAGLRGAGHDIDDAVVARMQAEGGAAGFVDIVARLLTATFGVRPCGSDPMAPPPKEGSSPVPFPGTT